MNTINSIAVIGSGTMGSGIAQVCAQHGLTVILFDINEPALDKAKETIEKNYSGAIEKGKMTEAEKTQAKARIKFSSEFEDLVADLCIEAIVEKLDKVYTYMI